MTVRPKSNGMIQAQSLTFSTLVQNLIILLASVWVKPGQEDSYIASCGDFEREYSEPTNAVFPSAGKAPRRVNEPANVHGECSVDRVHDGHFGKRLHHQVATQMVRKLSQRTANCFECIHHATYWEAIRFVSQGWTVRYSPMIMKPMTTAPGPPVWKALPLPTKRPAPIAPPLKSSQCVHCFKC
jgi:hypothetical protein